MPKHPMIEQLIEAHLDFLEQEFSHTATIQSEFFKFLSVVQKTDFAGDLVI